MGPSDAPREHVARGTYYDSGWIAGPPPLRGPPPFRAASHRFPRPSGRLVKLALVVAIVAAVFGIRAPWAQGPAMTVRTAGPLPRLEPTACRFETAPGRRVDCSDLLVPERRGDPDSTVIRLHVAVFRTDAAQPEPDPVVYLEGGPGGQALWDRYDFSDVPFLGHRDLVAFDQRGTGHSLPSLDCPEVDRVSLFSSGSWFDEREAMEDCRDRLIDADVDFAGYTSRESARDLDDLRLALGYDEWNLYGISYGSRLALTAMRDHPRGIRSAILDSVYPPHVDAHADGAHNASRAFVELFRACVTEPACDRSYPAIGKAFYRLVERLDDAPVTIDGVEIEGDVAIGFLFDQLYVRDRIPRLPSEIHAAVRGDHSALKGFLADHAAATAPGASYHRSIAEAVQASIDCAEEIPFTSVAAYTKASLGVRPEVVDYFDPEWSRLLCRWWEMPAPDRIENEPVTSDIPTLLLAGRFDPVTPAGWAFDAAEYLSESQVLVFGGSGHGVLPGSACAASVVESFLTEPGRPVDGECAEAESVRFE